LASLERLIRMKKEDNMVRRDACVFGGVEAEASVTLEGVETESQVGQAGLDRAIQLLALWARRRGKRLLSKLRETADDEATRRNRW
jgi:hypothetical protein